MGLIDRRVHHLAPLGLPVTLNGVSNTIIFKATGQDLANIDEILVF
jgi:hypothetical protein